MQIASEVLKQKALEKLRSFPSYLPHLPIDSLAELFDNGINQCIWKVDAIGQCFLEKERWLNEFHLKHEQGGARLERHSPLIPPPKQPLMEVWCDG